jgi:hypothetical protein
MTEAQLFSSRDRKHFATMWALALTVVLLAGCGGNLQPATLTLLDEAESRWQAWAFTVSGLFELVRSELAGSGGGSVQVELHKTYSFPSRLVLGPVYQDGQAVSGTEAIMTVRRFELVEVQE